MKKSMKNKKVKKVEEKEIDQGLKAPEFISWTKATVEDKIERCHFVIKDMMEALNKLQRDHAKLEANFFNHKHFDGMLMSQISQFGGPAKEQEKDTRTDDEKWF